MPASVDFVEVDEGGVGLLGPAARGRDDLAGDRGEADRDRDGRRSLAGSLSCGLSALPIPPTLLPPVGLNNRPHQIDTTAPRPSVVAERSAS